MSSIQDLMEHRMVSVFLKPTKQRRIVVFGGGNVALRKCRQFAGFDITVVAENTVDGIEDVCDRIIKERFGPSRISKYLEGAFIAVAATDNKELNAAITASASACDVLSNSVHGGGDVLLPSSVRKQGYTISVSSEGSVPAFSPFVAKRIDRFLGDEYDLMLRLLKELRKDLKEIVSEQPRRAEYLAEILDTDEIWRLLREKRLETAEKLALEIKKKYT